MTSKRRKQWTQAAICGVERELRTFDQEFEEWREREEADIRRDMEVDEVEDTVPVSVKVLAKLAARRFALSCAIEKLWILVQEVSELCPDCQVNVRTGAYEYGALAAGMVEKSEYLDVEPKIPEMFPDFKKES